MTTRTNSRCGAFLLILALIFSLALPCIAADNPVSEARSGVVRIFAWNRETGSCGSGTGFGVGTAGEETEYFVTNWHVITSNGEFAIGEMEVYILLSDEAVEISEYVSEEPDSNGYYYPISYISHIDESQLIRCQIVYSADQYPDVAILKAEQKVPGRVALPLRSSRDLAISESVYSLGYPAAADVSGYKEADLSNLQPGDLYGTYWYYGEVDSVHVNGGVVSKTDEFEFVGGTYCVEHDAHINSGNSGGPLVDENGAVVGINTYTMATDQFLNYSVYIDYAMDYLNQLGIAYDYVGREEPFPVPYAVIGSVVVAILMAALFVLKRKKPAVQPLTDTGLRVQYGAESVLSGKRYVINGTLRIGRAPDCSIRYPDGTPGISGHHCEITVEQGQVYIRDLNSSHGTYIAGDRIPANQPVPLSLGTTVILGSAKEIFKIVKSTKL